MNRPFIAGQLIAIAAEMNRLLNAGFAGRDFYLMHNVEDAVDCTAIMLNECLKVKFAPSLPKGALVLGLEVKP